VSLLTLTSYQDIRAVLGVSEDEISDDTLALTTWVTGLTLELLEVAALLPAQYTTVAAIAAGARTADQQWFYDLTRLYATYAVAKQLSSGLPLFSPKNITDGKASIGRFSDSPYKETIKAVQAGYERYQVALASAYSVVAAVSVTTVSRPWFSVASPNTDPVTG